jgi:small-conductance mechanosensitive channel
MSKSAHIALAVFLFATLGLLVPYAAIGENWGMVWYVAALPLSAWAEESAGIGTESVLLIPLISLLTAALWASVTYILTRVLLKK